MTCYVFYKIDKNGAVWFLSNMNVSSRQLVADGVPRDVSLTGVYGVEYRKALACNPLVNVVISFDANVARQISTETAASIAEVLMPKGEE